MAGLTNFLENALIDWFFRAQAIGITGASAGAGSGPATLYYALFTAARLEEGVASAADIDMSRVTPAAMMKFWPILSQDRLTRVLTAAVSYCRSATS